MKAHEISPSDIFFKSISFSINFLFFSFSCINPLASPSAGAPALNYRYVNTETSSPGEVKGLKFKLNKLILLLSGLITYKMEHGDFIFP